MVDDYKVRIFALSLAHIRQRMIDDQGILAMIDSGGLSLKVKKGALFGRDASEDFRDDLKRRVLEAQEFLDRSAFAVTDEMLVEAYETTDGVGPDAAILWKEARHRGLLD